MLGIHELWLFVLSGLLLNVTPGPDTAYIIGRTIQLGWRGGAAAAIGISCGCLVHVLGAAIGLSALLMASSTAFLAVKLIGAAYLVLTGLQMLLSRTKPIAEVAGQAGETSISRVFWQGALTNILNPKVALFFLALLPQFIAVDAPDKTLAFLFLGAWFIVQGLAFLLVLVALVTPLRRSRPRPWVGRGLKLSGAGLFTVLAAKLALTKP